MSFAGLPARAVSACSALRHSGPRQRRPRRQVFLDLKEAVPSAMAPYQAVRQPGGRQKPIASSPSSAASRPSLRLFSSRCVGRESYVLRELQPVEDRLSLDQARHDPARRRRTRHPMTQLAAWGQLRSGGHQGSATTDEWIDFSHDRSWAAPLTDYARGYTNVVCGDWKEFCEAYDDGVFATQISGTVAEHAARRHKNPPLLSTSTFLPSRRRSRSISLRPPPHPFRP